MKRFFITLTICLVSAFNVSAQDDLRSLRYNVAKAISEDNMEDAVAGLNILVSFGDEASMRILGEFYLEGTGVEKDYNTGVALLKKAAEKGDKEAKDILKKLNVSAKSEEPTSKEEMVFDLVEQMPVFNGDINKWLASNLKYPPTAAESMIQGRVMCKFIVEKDGSISNVEVVRSVDPALDKEACRVINSMPKWVPGKQNGKTVRCYFTMPVTFRLQ